MPVRPLEGRRNLLCGMSTTPKPIIPHRYVFFTLVLLQTQPLRQRYVLKIKLIRRVLRLAPLVNYERA